MSGLHLFWQIAIVLLALWGAICTVALVWAAWWVVGRDDECDVLDLPDF